MKVLLAVDGSPCSATATQEIARRPWPAGTTIKVLSAVKLQIPNTPDPYFLMAMTHKELLETQHKHAEGFVAQAVALLRAGEGTKDVDIITAVIKGNPKHVIVEEAENWGADLIVMGSHGHGVIGRFLLGSVSHAILAHAPCSVAIMRQRQ